MKIRKYRIVRDNYSGYECQIWRIWWPFWIQMEINTHSTLERAEEYIEEYIEKKVKNRGIVKEYHPKVPFVDAQYGSRHRKGPEIEETRNKIKCYDNRKKNRNRLHVGFQIEEYRS